MAPVKNSAEAANQNPGEFSSSQEKLDRLEANGNRRRDRGYIVLSHGLAP